MATRDPWSRLSEASPAARSLRRPEAPWLGLVMDRVDGQFRWRVEMCFGEESFFTGSGASCGRLRKAAAGN